MLRVTLGVLGLVGCQAACTAPQCPMPTLDIAGFMPCLQDPVPEACCKAARPFAANPCLRVWLKLPQLSPFQAQIEKARVACKVPMPSCAPDVEKVCPAECGVTAAAAPPAVIAAPATPTAATCAAAAECGGCTKLGCRWQGSCKPTCGISATTCYGGNSQCPVPVTPVVPPTTTVAAAPVPAAMCSAFTECASCTKLGCRWQGTCKSTCGISALTCYGGTQACPAPAITPVVLPVTPECNAFKSCATCTNANCRWQPAASLCAPTCMLMDTACYDGGRAPCPVEPEHKCKLNEEWTDCGSSSCWETRCVNGSVVLPADFCTADCRSGCRCKTGFARTNTSECVPNSVCGMTPCQARRAAELAACGGRLGCDTQGITCLADGSFAPKQCRGSTGICWCVTGAGKEIDGTRTAAGENKFLECPPKPKPKCGDVMCAMFCENGFEKDSNGCDVCRCKAAPVPVLPVTPCPCPLIMCKPGTQATIIPGTETNCCGGTWECKKLLPAQITTSPDSVAAGADLLGTEFAPDWPKPQVDMGTQFAPDWPKPRVPDFANPSAPTAGTPGKCGEVMCMMFCDEGFEKDSNGCDICKCKTASAVNTPKPKAAKAKAPKAKKAKKAKANGSSR